MKKCLISVVLLTCMLGHGVLWAKSGEKFDLQQLIELAEQAEDEGDFPLAAQYYEAGIRQARLLNDSTTVITLLYDYSIVLCSKSNFSAAIDALREVYENSSHNQLLQARAVMQLGNIYFFLNKYKLAMGYYRQSALLASALDNRTGLSIAQNNIGNVYQNLSQYDSAITYYNLSLRISEQLADSACMCNTYHNLGSCYLLLHQPEKAEGILYIALHIAKNINDKEIIALSMLQLGYIKIRKNQAAQGLALIDTAEYIAQTCGLENVMTEIYKQKVGDYEYLGRYRDALNCYKTYKTFTDSVFNLNTVSKLEEIRIKYQTQERDLQIAAQQVKLTKHRQRLWINFGALLISFLMIALLARQFAISHRRNRQLANAAKQQDKFLSIISHDLKNPVIAQRNALANFLNASNLKPEILREQGMVLLHSAESQLNLLHNLLSWSRLRMNRMPYEPICFDLRQTIAETIKLLTIQAEAKNIRIEVQAPPNAIAYADRNMIAIVIRNLLSNALKFSYNDSVINIEVDEQTDYFNVQVMDHGMGMTIPEVKNLFNNGNTKSAVGTQGERGSSLGLTVVKELIERNQGYIFVSSRLNEGSTFTFTVATAKAHAEADCKQQNADSQLNTSKLKKKKKHEKLAKV